MGAFRHTLRSHILTRTEFWTASLEALRDKLKVPEGISSTTFRMLTQPLRADNDTGATAAVKSTLKDLAVRGIFNDSIFAIIKDEPLLCSTLRYQLYCVTSLLNSCHDSSSLKFYGGIALPRIL